MGFKNVVGIYPYYYEVPVYEFFPPLGLEYVVAAVEDLVEDACVVDLRYEKEFETVVAAGADLFCVSVNWPYEYDSVCEVIRSLPADATTVVGGKFATENVEDLFERCPNVDVIVGGTARRRSGSSCKRARRWTWTACPIATTAASSTTPTAGWPPSRTRCTRIGGDAATNIRSATRRSAWGTASTRS